MFPNLQGAQVKISSPFNRSYNCHAWGVCETRVRWEPTPDDYWPPGLRTGNVLDYNLDNFIRAYSRVGFRESTHGRYEFGFQKIAIYSEEIAGEEWPQHTARQTFFGRGWLSKLGDWEDIRHRSTQDLEGQAYGRVMRYMKRSWIRALIEPNSIWMRATIDHWIYLRRHPLGI
ncbi:MAG: hypothetical protein ACLP7O_06320 [Terracidiphilus sp.]